MSSYLDSEDDPDARAYLYNDWELMRRMVGYLLRYRRGFAITSGLVALGIIFGLMAPFVLRQAIDVDFQSPDLIALLFTSLLYVLLQFLGWVTTYLTEYVSATVGQGAVYDIRRQLYEHLQVMSQDFYDKSSSGRIISRLTNDVDRISELLGSGLISTFAQFFIVFAIAGVLLNVDLQLGLASLSIVPILLIATLYFRSRLKAAYQQTRKTISNVTSNLAESISGAKVTKSFARERINMAIFGKLIRADYESNMDAGRPQSAFFPTIRFIGGLGVFVILWIGGFRLVEGTITLGTVVLFLSFSDQFFRPILTIANFYTTVQSAFAGAERVFNIMDTHPTVVDMPDAVDLPDINGHVRFRDVTFAYVQGNNVLEDFSLEVNAGETVAIVGDTGAGKTTVASLLNRFYDVDKGAIEIDGVDISRVKLDSLHSKVRLVLQDSFLFMGTVKENIRYGRPEASDGEVRAAIEAIGAQRIFDGLENGLDTEVGERGARLSEGERQLVSFARALLTDPRVLVLDEATSSVDVYTEYAIQRGMKRLLKGRTSLVIAHRLSTVVQADRILVLEKGRIVEEGTHSELMSKRGKYYSLYELQVRKRTAAHAEAALLKE